MADKKQEYINHLRALFKNTCLVGRFAYIRTNNVWRRCDIFNVIIDHFKKRYGGEATSISRYSNPTTELERIIRMAADDYDDIRITMPTPTRRKFIPLQNFKLNSTGISPYTDADYVVLRLAIDVTEDDIKNFKPSDDAGLFFIGIIRQFVLFRVALTSSLSSQRMHIPIVLYNYDESHPFMQVLIHMYGCTLKTHNKHDSDDLYLAKVSSCGMTRTSYKLLNIYRDPKRICDADSVAIIHLEKMEPLTPPEVDRLAKWLVLSLVAV